MRKVDLSVDIRNTAGKHQTRKLKRVEQVPGVLYGKQREANKLIQVDYKDISTLISKNGENVIVELKLGSETVPSIIKEVQRDPVDKRIIHLDFQPITLHEMIHAEVPIVVVNGNRVEKNGWIINKQIGSVELQGEVELIPQSIKLDVSKLRIGDVIKVADLEIAQELSVLSNLEDVVLSIRQFKEEPVDLEIDRPAPKETEGI